MQVGLTRDPLDPLGTALAAIVIGAAAGGALVCGVLIAVHELPRGADTPFAGIILGTGAAGLGCAALVAFTIARALGVWRAAGAAMTGVAGTALVVVLTTPADIAAGRLGLAVLGALCVGAMILARRIFFARAAA